MSDVRVLREHYHRMSPTLLNTFSLGVRDGVFVLYPSVFTTPPMMQTAFEDIIETFETTRTAFVNGGEAQRGPYTTALGKLQGALDEFANMVDEIPSLTTAIVNEAGFVATKEAPSEHHVPDGSKGVVNLRRGDSTGVIHSECSVVPEAEYYHAVICNLPMPEMRIENSKTLVFEKTGTYFRIDVSKSRKKTFEGLTAGQNYYIYYFIGNARGVSQITEGKSIMSA